MLDQRSQFYLDSTFILENEQLCSKVKQTMQHRQAKQIELNIPV